MQYVTDTWRRVIKTNDSSFIRITLEFFRAEPPCPSNGSQPLLFFGKEKRQAEAQVKFLFLLYQKKQIKHN